jgi:hypothetical protein
MPGRLWNALAVALALLLAGAVAAQGAQGTGAAGPPSSAILTEGIQLPGGRPAAAGAAAAGFTAYLPAVSKNLGGTCLSRPTLSSPANGSTLSTLAPLYVWNDGDDPAGTSSHLQIAHDAAFSDGAGSLRSSVRGDHEFRFSTNLSPGSTYYWRAWVRCGDIQGPYSEVWSFTTGSGGTILPAPALVAPANGSVLPGTTVSFQWSPVSGTVEYLLHWRLLDQGGYNYVWESDPQMTESGMEPNITFEWWVSARNDYAIGSDSPRWRFTTGPAPAFITLPAGDLVVDESGATIVQ